MNNESKININWFPGHMAKTRRQMTDDLKLVDVVIEVLDARIPISSQNPEIEKIIQNKKKIVVLNKCDLSDESENQKWVKYFAKQGKEVLLVNSNIGKGIHEVILKIQFIMRDELKKLAEKGRTGRKIRVMIVGIPNVGKSSLINRISKKSSTEVGDKPGVTKQRRWIRINDEIELMDTPGVLWPKFDSQEVALNLAFTGTIKEEILETTEIAYYLTRFLLKKYKRNLIERYSLNEININNILDQEQEENQNIYEIMQLIGKKRGAISSGGNVDDEKTARIILDDFRSGKIGRITLEQI